MIINLVLQLIEKRNGVVNNQFHLVQRRVNVTMEDGLHRVFLDDSSFLTPGIVTVRTPDGSILQHFPATKLGKELVEAEIHQLSYRYFSSAKETKLGHKVITFLDLSDGFCKEYVAADLTRWNVREYPKTLAFTDYEDLEGETIFRSYFKPPAVESLLAKFKLPGDYILMSTRPNFIPLALYWECNSVPPNPFSDMAIELMPNAGDDAYRLYPPTEQGNPLAFSPSFKGTFTIEGNFSAVTVDKLTFFQLMSKTNINSIVQMYAEAINSPRDVPVEVYGIAYTSET